MIRKKIWKLIALFAAISLIAVLCVFANSLVGNPLSKYLAIRSARNYLEQTYGNSDCVIDRTVYNFKDGNYHIFVISETSKDTHFSIIVDMLGNFVIDTYDSVVNKENTARRLENEYRELTDTVFESAAFPYESDIAFGTLMIYPQIYIDDPKITDIPFYALSQDTLEIDKVYDIRELGAASGKLVIYVDETVITEQRAAEIVLDIRKTMDDAGIPFRAMDFHLQTPLPTEGPRNGARIDLYDFLYEDIHADGLTEQILKQTES